ncbi:DNA mismatch repair endonuclease MutH [Paraferrimonas haliotis]|uniref:DNA mismatch repair endonuclease MutH n=1 Tax=Paraferrimonas haliotis TaxID=2013866 RepID=UPI000BA901B4|nr:DNA mismatch repair endonuclease MutH [Paraferrimonas haliotis]
MKKALSSPTSIDQLMERADAMAGLTLAELAERWQVQVPPDLRRDKGWVGQLMELQLGASAGNKAEPDFPEIDVELKTLPISYALAPLETTYVTVVPLTNIRALNWFDSVVYQKLKRVLWVPVQGEREIPVGDRIIGTPFLWQPSQQQLQMLRNDWEELMEMVALGNINSISAKFGDALHIRPKAANGRVLTDAIGEDGSPIKTLPRGFYLQKSFTQAILNQAFANDA